MVAVGVFSTGLKPEPAPETQPTNGQNQPKIKPFPPNPQSYRQAQNGDLESLVLQARKIWHKPLAPKQKRSPERIWRRLRPAGRAFIPPGTRVCLGERLPRAAGLSQHRSHRPKNSRNFAKHALRNPWHC